MTYIKPAKSATAISIRHPARIPLGPLKIHCTLRWNGEPPGSSMLGGRESIGDEPEATRILQSFAPLESSNGRDRVPPYAERARLQSIFSVSRRLETRVAAAHGGC